MAAVASPHHRHAANGIARVQSRFDRHSRLHPATLCLVARLEAFRTMLGTGSVLQLSSHHGKMMRRLLGPDSPTKAAPNFQSRYMYLATRVAV